MTHAALGTLRWFVLVAAVASVSATAGASDAADWDPNSPAVLRFTQARWSMIYPDRDFEAGCLTGYLAFKFSPTGYFVFNNRIRGSWRIDQLGNLQLRTRDGVRFALLVLSSGLRPIQDHGVIRRTQTYALCH
jgi:hypothetical protein